MSPAPALTFPGGRALAGWWRQLAAESLGQVQAVWFAHLFLHRTESLFEVAVATPLDPVSRLVLRALALTPQGRVADLDAALHLGPAVVRRMLHELQAVGLAEAGPGGDWLLTPQGRRAGEHDAFARTQRQRRVLHFVEDRPAGDRPPRPPHFLKLHGPPTGPCEAAPGWAFEPSLIEGCLKQPPGWKQSHDFPADLSALVPPSAGGLDNGTWQSVILDRAEHLAALLLTVRDAEAGPSRLVGFSVKPDGWALPSTRPVLNIAAGWEEVFPELTSEPSAEAWRQAWRAWCQPRGLPPAEVEACSVRRQGHVLKVEAPAKLLERMKAARSDAAKGEAWLLEGAGLIRPAAVIELVEASA